MYKKIILGLTFLCLFSSKESVCLSDDINEKIAEIIIIISKHSHEVAQTSMLNSSMTVINVGSQIYIWLWPTQEKIAEKEEAEIRTKLAQEKSNYLNIKSKIKEWPIQLRSATL